MFILSEIKIGMLDVNSSQLILALAVATFGGVAWMVKRIFHLGKLSERFKTLEKSVNEEIKPELKQINQKLYDLIVQTAGKDVTQSNSPRILNRAGEKILHDSGIGTIVEERFDEIVAIAKSKNPENSYQGEMAVIDAVKEIIANDSALRTRLEQGAFQSGNSLPVVILVGGIHIRDKVLKKLDLRPEDIDKHTP